MARMNYLAAIAAAQREALREDDRVIVMGEDVRANLYGTAPGFVDEFGLQRVLNLPISEAGFTGVAIGAAMTGLRPIVDYSYATFMYLAMDQLVNQAAKNRYMFGGQATIPVVFRASMWYGASSAAHHSDRPYAMFMGVPGLNIAVPSSPYEAKGLLRAAVACNDPVLVFEDATLWARKEEVPDEPYSIPLGVANVVREGGDVTVVAIAGAVHLAKQATEELTAQGISVELIDPRTLSPLDTDTIVRSVQKTGHLLVVDPAPRTCGAAAEIAAVVAEHAHDALCAPVRRLTAPDVHAPFSPAMEKPLYPSAADIVCAARDLALRNGCVGSAPR
ncbi:alpha-ketoacid dehydrogenase subunit beta [Mycobacterium deserti]|uniref:Alpha-ketoacid dehydrogenase subunit beta n=1 Tax=Mycobacterium deserti TaxID=2978347 RepID=A0ABT2M6E9_9MYCO|nr:transketolase C-terminal domain-containing protein [Mycobacterium deserti]MCT7657838.1 alpha-ketoacid dehydrogenase subunit beta [Mycobacterium deserti]